MTCWGKNWLLEQSIPPIQKKRPKVSTKTEKVSTKSRSKWNNWKALTKNCRVSQRNWSIELIFFKLTRIDLMWIFIDTMFLTIKTPRLNGSTPMNLGKLWTVESTKILKFLNSFKSRFWLYISHIFFVTGSLKSRVNLKFVSLFKRSKVQKTKNLIMLNNFFSDFFPLESFIR